MCRQIRHYQELHFGSVMFGEGASFGNRSHEVEQAVVDEIAQTVLGNVCADIARQTGIQPLLEVSSFAHGQLQYRQSL